MIRTIFLACGETYFNLLKIITKKLIWLLGFSHFLTVITLHLDFLHLSSELHWRWDYINLQLRRLDVNINLCWQILFSHLSLVEVPSRSCFPANFTMQKLKCKVNHYLLTSWLPFPLLFLILSHPATVCALVALLSCMGWLRLKKKYNAPILMCDANKITFIQFPEGLRQRIFIIHDFIQNLKLVFVQFN